MLSLIPQGQWATNKGVAECVEHVGFGVVGAVIDRHEDKLLLRMTLAAPDLLAALKGLLESAERTNKAFYVDGKAAALRTAFTGQRELMQAARAAIAKAAE